MGSREQLRTCFKCGCSPAKDNVKLFRFPKPGLFNTYRCSLWAKLVAPEEQSASNALHNSLHSKHRMLCAQHFDENCFLDKKKEKLRRTAVPIINDSRISAEETQAAIPNEDTSPSIQKDTAVSDSNTTAGSVTVGSDYEVEEELEEEVEVWAESESAEVLSCEECGQDADCGGKLYQCMECPRVVCAACEREERHRQHCLLRLPSRAVYDKLRTLYESLRDTVTAQLADDDEDAVPKRDPILEPGKLNIISNEVIIQPYNDYPKHVETDNSKRILVKAPSLVKTGSKIILIPGAESVPTPISVPAPEAVPIIRSVTEPKSVPKLIFEARLPKPKSVHESISVGGPLMLNLPGDHGHRYTVISTGAAKWSCSEKAKPTSGTEGFESTTTAKRKKPQKEDEEHLYMEAEYLATDEEEYW